MTDHPNVELIKQGYGAYGSGDIATLDKLIADDVVWHVGGRNALSGDYKGKPAVFEFFGKLQELSDGTSRVAVNDVMASDDNGVALVTQTATRSGRSYSGEAAHIFRIIDGQVTEFWEYDQDPYQTDEFWT